MHQEKLIVHISGTIILIERNNAYKMTPDKIPEDGLHIKTYKVLGLDKK